MAAERTGGKRNCLGSLNCSAQLLSLHTICGSFWLNNFYFNGYVCSFSSKLLFMTNESCFPYLTMRTNIVGKSIGPCYWAMLLGVLGQVP